MHVRKQLLKGIQPRSVARKRHLVSDQRQTIAFKFNLNIRLTESRQSKFDRISKCDSLLKGWIAAERGNYPRRGNSMWQTQQFRFGSTLLNTVATMRMSGKNVLHVIRQPNPITNVYTYSTTTSLPLNPTPVSPSVTINVECSCSCGVSTYLKILWSLIEKTNFWQLHLLHIRQPSVINLLHQVLLVLLYIIYLFWQFIYRLITTIS